MFAGGVAAVVGATAAAAADEVKDSDFSDITQRRLLSTRIFLISLLRRSANSEYGSVFASFLKITLKCAFLLLSYDGRGIGNSDTRALTRNTKTPDSFGN